MEQALQRGKEQKDKFPTSTYPDGDGEWEEEGEEEEQVDNTVANVQKISGNKLDKSF